MPTSRNAGRPGWARMWTAGIALAALAACTAPAASTPAPPPSQTITASLTPTVTPTSAPSSPPAPTSGPEATPYSPVYRPADVRLIQPDDWDIVDPRDASLPDLIIPDGDSYRVDPAWQVDKIEYLVGRAQGPIPTDGYQTIKRSSDIFINGSKRISPADVQVFISSLAHLHMVSKPVASYGLGEGAGPTKIELTGRDGQSILLESNTIDQPDLAPWTVYNNGRFYTQYDGALVGPLATLLTGLHFPTPYTASSKFGSQIVAFQRGSAPSEDYYGFSGLMRISNDFSYTADVTTHTIRGNIAVLRTPVADGSSIPSEWREKPTDIVLKQENGITSHCQLAWQEEAYWPEAIHTTFICSPGDFKQNQAYHYHLMVTIETPHGTTYQTEGELRGRWGTPPDFRVMPPPQELAVVFAATPSVQALLKNTRLVVTDYRQGQIARGESVPEKLAGEVVFAGEALIDGRKMRYTISSPFVIQDNKLTRWDLTTETLKQTLEGFAASHVIQNYVRDNPDAIVNLWYAKPFKMPAFDMPIMWNFDYAAQYQELACRPTGSKPPAEDTVQWLSFDSDPRATQWSAEFLLRDGTVVVNNLELDDLTSNPFRGLIPKELMAQPSLTFKNFRFYGSLLLFEMARHDNASLGAYQKLFDTFNVTLIPNAFFDDPSIEAKVDPIIGPDGVLRLVPCSDYKP